MLGQPVAMLIPQVVGVRLSGQLPEGATGTDLVLRVTEMLRERDVVGKFVEYFGQGLSNLALAARATISNMCPEYGATVGFFPVDDETLNYLRFTGRDEDLVALVEAYSRAQGLFRTDDTPDPTYSEVAELDLGSIEPSIAGPEAPAGPHRAERCEVGGTGGSRLLGRRGRLGRPAARRGRRR